MRPMLLTAIVLAALTACQTPFGFGGEEWDGTNDTAAGDPLPSYTPEDGASPSVLASHAFCADGRPQGMAAIVDGSDVWVTHVGFSNECTACADWTVTPATTDTDVVITYEDVDTTTCDCDCAVSGIEYVMTGFSAGTWTIAAGDDSVDVDLSE